MSDFLERDENYEPAVLPSPGELLHWEALHSPPPVDTGPVGFPEAKAPVLGADGAPVEPELTRFLPRARPGRYVIAAAVTAGVFVGIAFVVALTANATDAKGIAAYFAIIGAVAAGFTTVLWVWRWAGRRRSGIPLKRSNPAEAPGGSPAE
ncbi:MAG: hypothetical protein JW722_08750 [Demequinaceae bacterium]|nr:hypothetical protein [Demequinaceae bacterium]